MKLSARNILKGTVKSVTPGAVNTEVVLQLADGVEVVSIITKQSAESSGPPGRNDGLCGDQGQQRDDRRRLTFD